jgi:SNF2 family DNA or RNA helicase
MLSITDRQIKNIASNTGVYQRGIQLANMVSQCKYDKNKKALSGIVRETYPYDVFISFNSMGGINDYWCQCEAFFNYEGACKHVVALLEAAKEKVDWETGADAKDLYTPFPFRKEEKTKWRKARLWPEQSFRFCSQEGIYLNIRLKAGESRPYLVKNISNFLDAVRDEKALHFSRNYTMDLSITCFEGIDRQIVDFLSEILKREEKNRRMLSRNLRYYSANEYSIFDGDSVMLFEDNLKRYLEIVKDAGFRAEFEGRTLDGLKVAGDLDIELSVEEKGEELIVNADYSKSIKILALTDDFEYVMDPYNAVIYRIPEAKRKLVESVHNARYSKTKPVFKVKKQDRIFFLKNFLTEIEDSCKIEISPGLKEKLVERALTAKVYFDSAGRGIWARVEFCYGDKTVSPGASGNDSDIILRDTDNENNVIEFLRSSGLVQKDGLFVSDDEEVIVSLLSEKIEGLKEYAEVYYSEAFRSIQVTSVKNVQMGIRLNTQSNLLECDFRIDEFDDQELFSLLASVKEKKKYYRLKNGTIIKLDNKELKDLSELFRDLDIDEKKLKGNKLSLPSNRALYIDNFVKEKEFAGIKKSVDFEKLVAEILNPSELKFEPDRELKDILRDYQKFGYRWMKTLAYYGFGGILADDMGLGKTLQVLAFIKSEKGTAQKPNMVVAPTSLIYNWKAEVEKFVPKLKVLVITGNKAERAQQIKRINGYDIAVTSYGSLKRDIEFYENLEFSYVFVDEAQHIKNPATLNAGSVKSLKSKGCFALTGTPIENTLTELWSIFDFVMPGYLMSHHKFTSKFEAPIVRNNDKAALKLLSSYIKPFILRRVKQDVLKELPEKIESRIVADLTAEQKKLYAAYLKKAQSELTAEIKDKGIERSKIKILALLTRLRQLCCHPATFIDQYRGGSGKLETLLEILEDSTSSGHRVLVFSQFTSMLGIIGKELGQRNLEYFYLDGATKAEDRIGMVNCFNSGEKSIFLISLKAGGTGLNLTGADVVIHYDPWWNPSVEDQATDRAHRIGQTKAVQVFKIVARGTIEERILELQDKKKDLIRSVIKAGENLITKLSEKEIRELFQLDM